MKKLLFPMLSIVTVASLGSLSAVAQETDAKPKKKMFAIFAKAETLSESFASAQKSFEKGDTKSSATSIRSGASLIEKQIAVGDEKYTARLTGEVSDLRKLATGVEKGSIKKESTLNNAFASAHNSLAAYYNGRAERALAADNQKEAGNAMNAVANHIEKGASFAGHTLTTAGKKSVGLLRTTGGTLVKGAGTGVDAAGSVLKGGLGLITKIGTKIKGDKALGDKKVTDKTKAATGGAVEATGKTAEKAGDAVKKTGGVIKKAGDAIKGKPKTETPAE